MFPIGLVLFCEILGEKNQKSRSKEEFMTNLNQFSKS
jgi:hypothetical protein